jgi:hypothetical protein
MSDGDKQDKGFRVSDRRRFNVSGDDQVKEEVKEEGKATCGGEQNPTQAEEAPRKRPETAGKEAAGGGREEPAALPAINFATFVLSLGSSALIHLGLAPDPLTGEQNKDLPVAKQTIDMLGMLQEKTRGNLTEDEGQLLESLLYDLRMRYVAEAK